MGDGAPVYTTRLRPREAVAWVIAATSLLVAASSSRRCPYSWHGGAPGDSPGGSCWCGKADGYCMCTPSLAIDLVIETTLPDSAPGIVLVIRRDNGLAATMGGFVDVGETTEHAVARELLEETGLALAAPPTLLGMWSDPRRDQRRHTVSAVYVAPGDGAIRPGDDARGVKAFRLSELRDLHYAFDHDSIIAAYLRWREKHATQPRGSGHSTEPWVHTACV